MAESMIAPKDESSPKTTVYITNWSGTVQSRLIFYPPEIKRNYTLNIVIGPDGRIAREEDLEIL